TNRFAVTNSSSADQLRDFAYDALGNLVSSTNPEKGTTFYRSYDARGNLLLMQDAAGTQFKYTYDEAGRLALTETKLASPGAVFKKLRETKYKNVDADDPTGVYGDGALGHPINMKEYGIQ